MSPPIPADIIDEIIDNVHDLGDVKSLRNLALTSHLFLRRSQYHLFSSHICLDIEKLNSFSDFLDAHPDRRPWIRLVTISTTKKDMLSGSTPQAIPVPVRLFADLPNWNKWRTVGIWGLTRWISPDISKLICLRQYAHGITHVRLDYTSFQSCADFARYVLAFSGLRHLHCEWPVFEHKDNATALVLATEGLCKELRLSPLTIDHVSDVAVTLLLDSESAQRTLQKLAINVLNLTRFSASGAELYVDLPTLIPLNLSKNSFITLRALFVDVASTKRMGDIIRHIVETIQALASTPGLLITRITLRLDGRKISNRLEYLQNHSDDPGRCVARWKRVSAASHARGRSSSAIVFDDLFATERP